MIGSGRRDESRSDIRQLLDGLPGVPALLYDRHLTVVASNELCRALSPCFVEGENLARFTFLRAELDETVPGWVDSADQVAALLRDSVDQHDGADAGFDELVGELSAKSRAFAEAWAGEAQSKTTGTANFINSTVGRMALAYHVLRVPDDYDDVLLVWRATDPSSRLSLDRLAELTTGDAEA